MRELNSVSIYQYDDYRKFLQAVLDEKIRKNPSFSLRAFARSAKMSASHLSRTLAGKSKLSATTARQIVLTLETSAEESDHFLGLIELENAPSAEQKTKILRRLEKNQPSQWKTLSVENFRLISDWYHFAILNLVNLRDFKSDTKWIAKRLGILPAEAKTAVGRLMDLGLMRKVGAQYKAVTGADIKTPPDITSAAIQENHLQHLSLAKDALREVPVELRDFNNLTFSGQIKDIPRAKQVLEDFIERFNKDFETIPGQELFQLNIQFYLLTKQPKGES